MIKKVFISYRREDSKYQARRIYDALTATMPDDTIFMDVDSIAPGADFVEILEGWVKQCDILLALIGPDWLQSTDPRTNQRRLDNPEDFVRIEIQGALARKIPVVPVLLDSAQMPLAEELPDDMKALRRRNAEFVDYRTFDPDVQRLIKKLEIGETTAFEKTTTGNHEEPDDNKTELTPAPTAPKRTSFRRTWLTIGVSSLAIALAITISVRSHQSFSADATDLITKAREGQRTAETRAAELTASLDQSEKARRDAESKLQDQKIANDAAVSQLAQRLRDSDKAQQDVTAKRVAAEKQVDNLNASLKAATTSLQQEQQARQTAEAEVRRLNGLLTTSEDTRRTAELSLASAQETQKPAKITLAPGQDTPVRPASPVSATLLASMGSTARWAVGGASNCGNHTKVYTLAVNSASMTWRRESDHFVEQINFADESEVHTTTSFPQDKSGQTWTYSRKGDGLNVRPGDGNSFFLARCP
jgi:hypothetical protein